MALSVAGYDALLKSKLQAQSFNGHFFNGTLLPVFTLAVATGVVTVSLTATGTISSPAAVGASTGTGMDFGDGPISAQIKAECIAAFGQEGPVLQQFTDAIGQATVEHFALASLTSDTNGAAEFPVFSGLKAPMAAAIQAAAPTFTGTFWPAFCVAIANGICDEIANNGVGTLSGATGSGTGAGIVTIS
jgi:hypothetical protein